MKHSANGIRGSVLNTNLGVTEIRDNCSQTTGVEAVTSFVKSGLGMVFTSRIAKV